MKNIPTKFKNVRYGTLKYLDDFICNMSKIFPSQREKRYFVLTKSTWQQYEFETKHYFRTLRIARTYVTFRLMHGDVLFPVKISTKKHTREDIADRKRAKTPRERLFFDDLKTLPGVTVAKY